MEIAAWNLQFRFCLCVLKVSPRIKLSCVKEVSFVKLAVWHIFILFVSVVSSYQFENYLFSSKQNKNIFCIHLGYEREKQPGILGLVWCSQPGFTMIRQGHSETIMGQVENKILTISEQRQSHCPNTQRSHTPSLADECDCASSTLSFYLSQVGLFSWIWLLKAEE